MLLKQDKTSLPKALISLSKQVKKSSNLSLKFLDFYR